MKLMSSSTPPPHLPFILAKFRGTLPTKRRICLNVYSLLLMAALWNTNSVLAAPAKLDLQPPIFEASAALQTKGENDATTTTIDSYGNPIENLQPIETPDGRKVVSAQGLQFEIPNYASGITEIKKPSDDLLPPFVDPIVVALPSSSPESFTTNSDSSSSAERSTVDVESVPLVKVSSSQNVLPQYILELNDPDIAGPVPYEPSEDSRGLKVIAWDLLPPIKADEADKAISHSNKVSVTSDHNPNAQAARKSSHVTSYNLETTTKPSISQNRGSTFYSSTSTTRSTTPRTTTTRRTTTTTTSRPTTTPRTTTTTTPKPTTTPRTTTTSRTTTSRITTTSTTPEPDPSTFFKLENGDSYTLPTWLQEYDYPDLDVAVAYVIPDDLNEYNQTIERDILPPLEPYTDLNNLHVTPPATTTTPRTTTTRKTTTITTTKRPTVSISQSHWVRAKPTVTKPTIATFNNQFASPSQAITPSSSFNFAQRTSSTTKPIITTTTTITTVKPKTTTNYNKPVSTTTPRTDKFGSDLKGEEVTTKTKSNNPFLSSHSFDDGKYRPQNYAGRQNTATTTRRPTTTTTTTTPTPVEKNPFQPTIPPYLLDFDYPDLGPGVPFVYDPNEDENPVDKNILPPSQTIEDSDRPDSASKPSSSNPPFSNSQTPQGFTNKFTTSAISLASSSSIPSIVTAPLPSTQTNQNQDVLSTATQLPVVFVPPPPTSAEGITTTFNKHFAASFEPATTPSAASSFISTAETEKKVPLSADRESFPPFNNIITGSTTLPSKTTFTKSEDGKVITNNIFLSGGLATSTSVKPTAFSSSGNNQEKATFVSTGQSLTKTTTSSLDGANTSSTFGSKYTGRFGGPPGVLAPQSNNAFAAASTTATKTYNNPTASTAVNTGSLANHKFTGSFGGPPGILKPYDNIKSG